MGFEEFTEVGRGNEPRISLRKNGQLGFNRGALSKYGLARFARVILFYDKDERRVGVRLTNEIKSNTLKLHVKEFDAYVPAKSFMDFYEIRPEKTTSYKPVWSVEDDMLIIALK